MERRRFLAAVGGLAAGLTAGTDLEAGQSPQQAALRINGARLNRRLSQLAQFGGNAEGGIDRVAYSEADLAARVWVTGIMREAGLEVRIDAAGNLLGRMAGRNTGAPALMTGSHIDSVPGGGNYDGQVGAMAAIEAAQVLRENRVTLTHPLDVIIFQNEENGKVGSKAIRGDDPAAWLDLPTHSGKTIREGIRFLGGDPDGLASARLRPGQVAAFLELHIEQGAILARENIAIGVVEGIVGIKRWAVTVEGFANHAGTTPMDQRQDALLAAARFIDAAHRITRAAPGRQVATVGTIVAEPNAANVIAGRAKLTLEMRDLDLGHVDEICARIRAEAEAIGRDTGTRFTWQEIYRTLPAATDPRMRELIAVAARELGLSTLSLPSGAGHDAQEMALIAPMGMIFVPSAGGISHSPREFSAAVDIENGANVLLQAILRCDRL
jgi:N-carbamoyl-L-amino-acid hydrolase